MKTYGSTTGTANKIKNFYGAVDHKAMLATKVYGPALMPDAFDTLTIRSGGVGNITGTDPATFTEHFISSDSLYWNRIVSGEIVPVRLEVVRSGSFLRTRYLNLIYKYAGSSAENTEHLLSSTATSDSNFKDGLTRYGFSYKSSFSNGTDVIDLTISEALKTKLIHKGFSPTDWGEATFHTGYTIQKSLQYAPGYSGPNLTSISYTGFNNFINSSHIDTTGQVEFVGASSLSDRYWYFPKIGGGTVAVKQSDLYSTTYISASNSNFTTQHLFFAFFDKRLPDSSSPLATKKILNKEEFDTLYEDCYPNNTPMRNVEHVLGGIRVPAGSVTKFVFGNAPSTIENGFLYYDSLLEEIDTTKWRVSNIGNNFLGRCQNLVGGDIVFSKHLMSIGDSFLYNCLKFTGNVIFDRTAKIKAINKNFMYYCQNFNNSIALPTGINTIGDYFMYHCDKFNSSLTLPTSVISFGNYFLAYNYVFNHTVSLPVATGFSIGSYFMYYCYSFNQNFTIPGSVSSIGTFFMSYMGDMVSTVSCNSAATVASTSNYTFCARGNSYASYTTGIKLGGTYGSDWQARFPDRTSSPYRNTDVA